MSKLGTPEYTYHQIEVDDSTKENLRNHFASCAKFIDEAIKDEKSVLVHCAAGVSRSASIIIAFLIITKKMDYDTAFNFVKERRTKIMPNSAFVGQLQELAESVKNNSF